MDKNKIDNTLGKFRLPEGADLSKVIPEASPLRLHLEIIRRDLTKEEYNAGTHILQTYGDVKYGENISRDILVPEGMPLWALNYAIQRCFGWQNSHLHSFTLPEERLNALMGDTAAHYKNLVGVVFRSPWMDEEEKFWADDYKTGSFKTWLKKKYTGPYCFVCHGEGICPCREDMESIRYRYAYAEVEHFCGTNAQADQGKKELYCNLNCITKDEYHKRIEAGQKNGVANGAVEVVQDIQKYSGINGSFGRRFSEVYRFDDIPWEALQWISESNLTHLLERLQIGDILAYHDQGIDDKLFFGDRIPQSYDKFFDEELEDEIAYCEVEDRPDLQPMIGSISDTLFYNYDFGDDWCVKITGSLGAADLVKSGRLTQKELEEAVLTVHTTYKPVCIAQDGYPVMDDVGGMDGYICFLQRLHSDADSIHEALEWAKSMGWSKRKINNKNLL